MKVRWEVWCSLQLRVWCTIGSAYSIRLVECYIDGVRGDCDSPISGDNGTLHGT